MDDTIQLQQAIEQLYTIFALYKTSNKMAACPHCVTQAEINDLTRVPLRLLTAEQLWRYTFKAMSTWGDERDFRHFLPRILELSAFNPGSYELELDMVCRQLDHGKWSDWPEEEQQAILQYFVIQWRLLLSSFTEETRYRVINYVNALGFMALDITPFLSYWRQERSLSATRHLVAFIDEHKDEIPFQHRLKYWYGYQSIAQHIIAWLLETETRLRLEDDFFRYADEAFADELAQSIDALYWWQKIY
ncbi:hypothetical protein [Dictyobacter formicarum]|uniref:Uncharacterized protein n=1 Tax=Dictyobacter formicarum TaxID=2778368 RepID=A0ABQ3VFD3_9CHLR|nr:hypothetical protein [Dictyobacter formicarum]GHO84875.1 hypothetical protein KSZ_28810 [Dictyobacter formicarum]